MTDLDSSLVKSHAYVDGAWVGADDGRRFDVLDPATGEVLGNVPDMGAAETRRAIEAADAAWGPWRKRTAKDRAAILMAWYDLIMAHKDALAVTGMVGGTIRATWAAMSARTPMESNACSSDSSAITRLSEYRKWARGSGVTTVSPLRQAWARAA